MAKIAWSGALDGRWILSWVFSSTTRAAILIKRSRRVSNCMTRQVERLVLRRAYRGDCGDHRSDVAGAGRAFHQCSELGRWIALARCLRRYSGATMVAVAVAIMLTVGLFRTIGPKHTRLCAQIVAAVIGASFAIGLQFGAILSYGTPSRIVFLQSEALTRYAPDSASILWWPSSQAFSSS